jgi:hypothetical protein
MVADAIGTPTLRRPVVVVGAGPSGLAAAAYLRDAGVPTRVFGETLGFWRGSMPSGMLLRSEARAASIADPRRSVTLAGWASLHDRALPDPVPVETWLDYGRWYADCKVGDIDERLVASVGRRARAFTVRLEGGEELEAARVVVAAGIAPFARRPPFAANLPQSLVSHCADHDDLSSFAGRRVAVLGCGQSALESAALLAECGASVEVIARVPGVRWLDGAITAGPIAGELNGGACGRRRRLLRTPVAPIGIGGRLTSWLAAAPDLYRRLPDGAQQLVSERCVFPAGAIWLRRRLGSVPLRAGRSIIAATPDQGGLRLTLDDGAELIVDHLLLGTGYQIDLAAYHFLAPDLRDQIRTVGGYPVLGPGLETSVAGLHVLGAAAARAFGPVMCFVVGTWYSAPAVLARVLGRRQPPLRWSF